MAYPDWKAGDKLEVIEAFKNGDNDLPLGRVVEFIRFEDKFTVIQPTAGCESLKWYTARFKKIEAVAAKAAPCPFLIGDKVHVINPRNMDENGKSLAGGPIRWDRGIPEPEDIFTIRNTHQNYATLNDATGKEYQWVYDYKSLKHVEEKEQKQMTFDEAYEQARALRIVGRGSMNKAQLFAAIVAAKAAPAVKPAAPLAAPAKPPKPTLGEELRQKTGNDPGTCSYAMEWDNGHRRFQIGDVCHARMKTASVYESKENREKEAKATLVACALDVKGHYENAGDKPAYRAWVDYFINRSPFAVAFKTKNVDEAMEEAVYMDVTQPNSYLVAAAIGLRQASEFPYRLATWKQLVAAGFSEKAAHFMCHHLSGGMFVPDSGGHSPFTTPMTKDEFLSFFKKGFKNTNEAPANKNFSTYRVFACIADPDAYYANPKTVTLGKYLEEILKHKPVGYGGKQLPIPQRILFAAMEQIEKDIVA